MERLPPLTRKEFRKRYRKLMFEERKENFAWFIFISGVFILASVYSLLVYFLFEAIRNYFKYT